MFTVIQISPTIENITRIPRRPNIIVTDTIPKGMKCEFCGKRDAVRQCDRCEFYVCIDCNFGGGSTCACCQGSQTTDFSIVSKTCQECGVPFPVAEAFDQKHNLTVCSECAHKVSIMSQNEHYDIIDVGRQVDLEEKYLAGDKLRAKIGFATSNMHEDLHWEEGYEFLIPQDGPVSVKIFQNKYDHDDKGSQNLATFDEVKVQPGQMLIIHPEYCHLVEEKQRFLALKVSGKFKRVPKKDTNEPGNCPNENCSIRALCLKISTS